MKIKPIGKVIYLRLDTVEQVGGKNVSLDTSSKKTTREFAEVLAIGPEVTQVKVGDKVFIKGWAIDMIMHDKQEYFFTHEDANGLCAVVSL
jgi:co-chaperonin GroES (HSP10)